MSVEIFVNIAPRETRAALLEGGVLQEIHIERASRRGLVGNLYKGRVTRVLPGMQAAFVEVGLARTAFLHAHDIAGSDARLDAQRVAAEGPAEGAAGTRAPESVSAPEAAEVDIRRLVSPGDDLLVQVVKDPMGAKGARLTTFVTLPSRYLVFMPRGRGLGISARIEDETERRRLREAMQALVAEGHPGGYIVRTAAEGVDEARLAADLGYLERLWAQVRERQLRAAPGELVHEDLPLARRVLRDELARGVERVLVDDVEELAQLQRFVHDFLPGHAPRLELHAAVRPIFDLHNIDAEVNRALARRVDLKSGGYLVFDQTEALTTIDVNTGAFVGAKNFDDTVFKTNLEAAGTIARQLRLRNLGGIVIVDFIDMARDEHRQAVLAELKKHLSRDRTRTTVGGFTSLGLLELTRKRTRESLSRMLCEPCPTCQGRGQVKTARTVCYDILREILREARQFSAKEFRVVAAAEVVEMLLDEESAHLAGLSDFIGRPISLTAEPGNQTEHYDIVLL